MSKFTLSKFTLSELCPNNPLVDMKWTAVALLYGAPPKQFHARYPLTEFRIALEKVFDPEEVKRVGLRRMAMDYAEWYAHNEDHARQGACDDGLLSQAQDQVREPRHIPQHGEERAALQHHGTERSTHSLPA